MKGRIFGLETEYGCLTPDADPRLTPEYIAARIKDWIFYREELGIVDMHYRGRDEPPGNGGFLFNGGRVYVDMGHLEYATPECCGLFDLIAADRAGDLMLQRCLEQLPMSQPAALIKNNIDHYTGATFGCHENYLVRREVSFGRVVLPALLPFFVTRQVFAGAGRVGSYSDLYDGATLAGDDVDYQISQRADHIVTEIYQWIQFSRAIVNTRDEPLADWCQYRRLHLLVGDSNMSEYATALKVGTTAVLLQLIEAGVVPDIRLLDPVEAVRTISRDQTYSWVVQCADGSHTTAVDVQQRYLHLAEYYLRGSDAEVNWVLDEWRFVLDGLAHDPFSLMDRIDWVAKRTLLERFMESEGLDWHDPWIKSLDLEYHNLDPARGLYHWLAEQGFARRVVTHEQVYRAVANPPEDTRAVARSAVMRALTRQKGRYVIDWDSVYVEEEHYLSLDDPLRSYQHEVAEFIDECSGRRDDIEL